MLAHFKIERAAMGEVVLLEVGSGQVVPSQAPLRDRCYFLAFTRRDNCALEYPPERCPLLGKRLFRRVSPIMTVKVARSLLMVRRARSTPKAASRSSRPTKPAKWSSSCSAPSSSAARPSAVPATSWSTSAWR